MITVELGRGRWFIKWIHITLLLLLTSLPYCKLVEVKWSVHLQALSRTWYSLEVEGLHLEAFKNISDFIAHQPPNFICFELFLVRISPSELKVVLESSPACLYTFISPWHSFYSCVLAILFPRYASYFAAFFFLRHLMLCTLRDHYLYICVILVSRFKNFWKCFVLFIFSSGRCASSQWKK